MPSRNERAQWAFDASPNAAAVTVRQVIEGDEPILFVVHDADDGTWLFLASNVLNLADAMLVDLKRVVDRDPTVAELADLQRGWQATRKGVGLPWVRRIKS